MLEVVAALAGVALGGAITLINTRLTIRSAMRLADTSRLEERDRALRDLVASVYINSVDALQWLRTMHVEDYINVAVADEYRPKTASALDALREGRQACMKLAAVARTQGMRTLASEIALSLNVVDDAWDSAWRSLAKWDEVEKSGATKKHIYYVIFEESYGRLDVARKRLVGANTDLPRKEIDRGLIQPDSLLGKLYDQSAEDLGVTQERPD